MAVFKRFDHDRSGTMEVTELESALDQYFDEVAAEFAELREDDVGRSQPRSVNGPLPPSLRKCGDDVENLKVLLEWSSSVYKGRKLVLQGMKVHNSESSQIHNTAISLPTSVTPTLPGAAKSIKESEEGWKTVYEGEKPTVEITLSDPSALFIFRLATCKHKQEIVSDSGNKKKGKDDKGGVFQPEYSAHVFWLGRPDAPTVCGIGCNILASWCFPHIHSMRPPIPVWKIHVRKCVRSNDLSSESLSLQDNEGNDWVVTQAPLGSSSCVVSGLKCRTGALGNILNRYEVCLSCELPSGHSSISQPTVYSTTIPAPTVECETDVNLRPPSLPSQSLSLIMPQPIGDLGYLSNAGVVPFYSTEGLSSEGEWEVLYEGSESRVTLHGLPFDTVSLIRVNCALDLRTCSRYGTGIITVSSKSHSHSHSHPVVLQRRGSVAVEGNLTPAFGCREGVPYEDGTWPGASRARSLKYKGLLLSPSHSALPVSWDMGTSTTVCLPPSPPFFDGDAADFSATLNASNSVNACERLSILWSKPRGIIPESKKADLKKRGTSLGLLGVIQGHGKAGKLSKDITALCGTLEAEYVCEVFDTTEGGGWKRVYKGSAVGCHLSSFDVGSSDWLREGGCGVLKDLTSCLLFRYGRRFVNTKTPSAQVKEKARRHSFVAEKRTAWTPASRLGSRSGSRSAGAKRTATPERHVTEREEDWMYSSPIVAVLSPPPPLCSWADELKKGVIVKWGVDIDESRIPKGWHMKPQRFALEVYPLFTLFFTDTHIYIYNTMTHTIQHTYNI